MKAEECHDSWEKIRTLNDREGWYAEGMILGIALVGVPIDLSYEDAKLAVKDLVTDAVFGEDIE